MLCCKNAHLLLSILLESVNSYNIIVTKSWSHEHYLPHRKYIRILCSHTLQIRLSCAILCQMVPFQYSLSLSLHRLVHRLSRNLLMCRHAQVHFCLLNCLIHLWPLSACNLITRIVVLVWWWHDFKRQAIMTRNTCLIFRDLIPSLWQVARFNLQSVAIHPLRTHIRK